jgi:hypothetical protein
MKEATKSEWIRHESLQAVGAVGIANQDKSSISSGCYRYGNRAIGFLISNDKENGQVSAIKPKEFK